MNGQMFGTKSNHLVEDYWLCSNLERDGLCQVKTLKTGHMLNTYTHTHTKKENHEDLGLDITTATYNRDW